MGAGTAKYWAFISYSHRDARVAAAVQRALETYRIPRRLVSPLSVRLAVVRALASGSMLAGAGELAGWARRHDPAADAATLVEQLVRQPAPPNPRHWTSLD